MTLRERVLLFAAVLAIILFFVYIGAMEPLLNRQKELQAQIHQQDNQIAGIDMEITAKAQGFVSDPDAATRARVAAVRREIDTTSAGLMAMQKGLVAPERIAPLLEHLLRGNGKLKLLSLRTLPVSGLNEVLTKPAAAEPKPAAGAAAAVPKPRELLYRHGVEMVLQGSYLDMISYMDALEKLPVQLFWGKAQLDAQQYPNAQLTLTLYTLSLDQKWMKL
jgi:MSHA biogenesis protein MshJ